jgi:hypothetical protein
MSESPYTIIAAGVTTLPQRVAMPYSLINTVGELVSGASPALNVISPGWVLSDNAYTVVRNENKFVARQAAAGPRGAPWYSARVVRGEHVRLVLAAADRLRALEGRSRLNDASGAKIVLFFALASFHFNII